ncbi:MAG: ATP-grasp domain-containing protein [Luteolibacter sp.]
MNYEPKSKHRVVVAGAAGASLGTETLKALALSGRYEAIAADITPLAYGLYQKEAKASHLLDAKNYLESLIECCHEERASFVLPSSEPTLKIISEAGDRLRSEGITPIYNRPEVIRVCSDKSATFDVLKSIDVPVPRTKTLKTPEDIKELAMPCIIKPATDTGASMMVSPASTHAEALMYAQWIWSAGLTAIGQEYLSHAEGEFTVGVLRFGDWIGAIAMKREFPCKLSYIQKNEKFLISSGYSQGLIDHFPEICDQAKKIAIALDSQGPLNIQGRLVDGIFYPFEINPRFSGTTLLRTMAGFPEIEIYLDHLNGDPAPPQPVIKPGYYMRSFAEQYIPKDKVKHLP